MCAMLKTDWVRKQEVLTPLKIVIAAIQRNSRKQFLGLKQVRKILNEFFDILKNFPGLKKYEAFTAEDNVLTKQLVCA